MTEKEKIVKVIYRAVDSVNSDLAPDRKIVKDPSTRLLGTQSVLDSLDIVTLIMAIERGLESIFKIPVRLVIDHTLLKKKNSPFFSILSLTNYIEVLLKEAKNG